MESLFSHSFLKRSHFKAYNLIYRNDFLYLSEVYLDSTTFASLLDITGCNLVCEYHPDNIIRGGVCIYYKNSLRVRVATLPYVQEELLLGMTYNK